MVMQRRLPLDTQITEFDEWRGLIAQLMPEPVVHASSSEENAWIVGGAPPEVIVRVSPRALSVFEFVDGGSAADGPTLRHNQVGRVDWSRLPREVALVLTGSLIDLARQSRRSRISLCRSCSATAAAEDLQTGSVCRHCVDHLVGLDGGRRLDAPPARAAAARVRGAEANLRGRAPGSR
jgi:hypothetical protein